MPHALPYPEPDATADPARLVLRLLDYYRSAVLARARSLDDDTARRTTVPSGWTPLTLLWHLAHMERRWIEWGFLGRPVDAPWGDHDPQSPGRWVVPDGLTLDEAVARITAVARLTTEVLSGTPPATLAALGGRFASDPPSLLAISLHLLQEWARHAGHLDVSVELAGGAVGE